MATTQKEGIRAVEVDREDLEKKLRAHRRRVAAAVFVILLLLAAAAAITYYYYENKVYSAYDVISSEERKDAGAPYFASFRGKLLKCTNDGAVYTELDGTPIWNQTYEMDRPMVETCGDYVAIYEPSGTQAYILDIVGLQGSIHTTLPIQKVSIASQGTTAILMEDDGTGYLQLYDKKGAILASGELHVQNSGYPLDIALSENGEKMAVSMLDINDGALKTAIAFYNFGAVGQNEIDKIVSSYSYEDVVIPQIQYLADDTMAAFGDNRVILFTGPQKPAEAKTIELAGKVKSVFYDSTHFGLIYDGTDGKKYRLELYNLSGGRVMEVAFDIDYTDVEIWDNGELCILGEDSCEIYNPRGECKFAYSFGKHIYRIWPGRLRTDYSFLLEGEMQRVKLR